MQPLPTADPARAAFPSGSLSHSAGPPRRRAIPETCAPGAYGPPLGPAMKAPWTAQPANTKKRTQNNYSSTSGSPSTPRFLDPAREGGRWSSSSELPVSAQSKHVHDSPSQRAAPAFALNNRERLTRGPLFARAAGGHRRRPEHGRPHGGAGAPPARRPGARRRRPGKRLAFGEEPRGPGRKRPRPAAPWGPGTPEPPATPDLCRRDRGTRLLQKIHRIEDVATKPASVFPTQPAQPLPS